MAETKDKTVEKSYFEVMRLCCSSEVGLVESILKSLDGVHDVRVIVPTKTVIVIHDTLLVSPLQIVKALNQGRLEASLRVNGKGNNYRNKWPSPYVVASGLLLLVSLFKFVYHPLRWVALGAVAAGVYPILMRAFASLRNYRLDTNCLMLTAVAGTIAMNDYVEAGVIVFLFTIAEWLETRASHKARAVMSSLMSIAPQRAVIAESGEEVDVDKVKLNTVVVVKGGEVIPIDGIVVDGSCEVDEKMLTGESFPVPKLIDSTVWAGTINVNGYIEVKTTALAEDCVVAKMARLVEDAQNSKSKTQRFIDNFAQYYTPAVIIISAAIAVVPLVSKVHNRNKWFHLALVVLVSACPCALILSTPVATFCALTKAATAGLLIKGGDYIETLAKVKTVAFDKTGTITRGEFVVTDFQSLSHGVNLEELLYWVSSIESKSSHPMAAALVDYAGSLSVQSKSENVVEFINFPGEGIYGKIDGRDVYIGNRKIAIRAGSGTESSVPALEPERSCGKTIGYVYSGANPAGIFTLSDACRTGVSEALRDLKLLGIRTAMLTGDSEAAALYAQEQLEHGVEVVHSELLPQDKARIIEELKKEGPTAMVGDGMNDAPALATADIGISMGISGSALAMETGHVILMSNDLRKVPKVIRLARKAHRKVVENVVLSIIPKAAILALAIAGHPLVWAAVLADVGTCLLVILNSMLLLKHQRSPNDGAGKCCKPSVVQNNQNVLNQDCCSQTSQPSSNSCCTNSKCTDEAPRQQKKEVQEAKPCCGGGSSAKRKDEVSNLGGSVCSRRLISESSIRDSCQIQCCKPSVMQNNQNVLNQDCCSQNVGNASKVDRASSTSKCRTSQPSSNSCCTKNKCTEAAPRQPEKEVQEGKPCCGGGYSANRKEELGNSCGTGCSRGDILDCSPRDGGQIPVEKQGRSLGQAVDECCRDSSNADDIGMDIHEDDQKCCEETKTSKSGCRKSLEHREKDGCSNTKKACCGSKVGQFATGYVAIDIYDTETKGSRNSCNKKLEYGEKDDCCKSYAKECCGSEGEMNSSRSGCHKSMELKEKEKDDCCKSYMKECCRRRRGQFATGFARSVSGINIIN